MNRVQRNKDWMRFIPSFLLLLSFLTHDSQLLVYKISVSLIVVALFGVFYLVIAIFLLLGNRFSPVAGSIVPAIGASLGIYRFFIIAPNPFSVFNVCLDAIIVPFSLILYMRWTRST
ncbi:MAG: hypothetical protein M0Z77_01270 [Thermoplasmatales archaeon]|nr:hypothetical protein [Thermoplasmatales archaeon]